MDDNRVWKFEKSLWTGSIENYREKIDDECLMVLPQPPYVMTGEQAIEAVQNTPRWNEVDFNDAQIGRPEEGIIVVAYTAKAKRGEETYEASCTSTYRRLAHEEWRIIQHQQTPPLAAKN